MTEQQEQWWNSQKIDLTYSHREITDDFTRLLVDVCLKDTEAQELIVRMSKYGYLRYCESASCAEAFSAPTALELIERIRNIYLYIFAETAEDLTIYELIAGMNQLKWDEHSYSDTEIIEYLTPKLCTTKPEQK